MSIVTGPILQNIRPIPYNPLPDSVSGRTLRRYQTYLKNFGQEGFQNLLGQWNTDFRDEAIKKEHQYEYHGKKLSGTNIRILQSISPTLFSKLPRLVRSWKSLKKPPNITAIDASWKDNLRFSTSTAEVINNPFQTLGPIAPIRGANPHNRQSSAVITRGRRLAAKHTGHSGLRREVLIAPALNDIPIDPRLTDTQPEREMGTSSSVITMRLEEMPIPANFKDFYAPISIPTPSHAKNTSSSSSTGFAAAATTKTTSTLQPHENPEDTTTITVEPPRAKQESRKLESQNDSNKPRRAKRVKPNAPQADTPKKSTYALRSKGKVN